MQLANKLTRAMALAGVLALGGMAADTDKKAEAAPEVPRKSPEFAVVLPENGQRLLSEYRGKVVLLAFVFTTCPHCQRACQLMEKLSAEYGAKGFQPLAVAWNEGAKGLVPDFVRDYKLSFPVGYSTRETVCSYLQLSPEARLSVPQVVFIDRKGTIRQQSLMANDAVAATEPNMRKMIELLLKEPGAITKHSGRKKT